MGTLNLMILLMACGLRSPGPSADTAAPGTDGGGDGGTDTGDPIDVVEWSLEAVAQGSFGELTGVTTALVAGSNGHSYFMDAAGEEIRYLTEAYVHPTGDYCLGSSSSDTECERGTPFTAGRIQPTSSFSTMCLDDAGGRLFLVRAAGAIEVVDTYAGGESAYTHNRISQALNAAGAGEGSWGGPCVYLPHMDALLLSDSTTGALVAIAAGNGQLLASGELGFPSEELYVLADGSAIVGASDAQHELVLVSAADLTELARTGAGGAVADFAIDPATGDVFVAHGDEDGASRVPILGSGSPVSLPVTGIVDSVVVDPSQGFAYFGQSNAEGWSVTVVGDDATRGRYEGGGTMWGMATPDDGGDVVVALQAAGTAQFMVLDAVPDHKPADTPPLMAFLATAIESPSDDDIDIPCLAADAAPGQASGESLVALVKGNAAIVAELGVPVAVAITWNFASTMQRCGTTDIFDHLRGYGFRLGSMVHNRPCYNCTDVDVVLDSDSGEWLPPAAQCEQRSEYYCDPQSEGSDCCFPDDPDYCNLGDWECYKTYIDARNHLVDGLIDPDGGGFIIGADRHGMWEWDWVRGYQEMARADGTRGGYDVTYFGHGWAYTDEVSFTDARGKNMAPWRPSDRVEAWPIGYSEQWSEASAYSNLMYLPGMNTSMLKVAEWQQSGLFLLDFFLQFTPVTYSEEDFTAVNQFLRQSLNRRSQHGVNTWYFHVHDLALSNLVDDNGDEKPGADMLRAWMTDVDEKYVQTGQIEWMLPDDIRDTYGPEPVR